MVSGVARDILVVGGGIAGASIATLLGRAGDRVTLVERDQGQRSSGSPVDVRGSALPVIERLGVASRLREADTGVRFVEFVDQRGRRRARAELRRGGSADIEIGRSALNGILFEAAAGVADVTFADGPERVVPGDEGVDVTFTSGAESRFDLVVGADGQHSTVRSLAFGPEHAYSRPLGLGIATVPVTHAPVSAPDVVQICNLPGASMSVHPAGGHPVAAFIFRTDDRAPAQGREAQQQLLQLHYRNRGWRSQELLQAVSDADDLYFDTVNRVDVPTWHRGRIILLGDAASSITILGEGCSMAIAGAGLLADTLSNVEEIDNALAAFERAHASEVRKKQRGAGYGASVLVPKTRAGIAVRNALLRIVKRV